jgi:DedD protein
MPPDQVNEQEIQFKKRARRRLVGAVALVLLMITVLPMVLDDRSGKTPQQEIAITIPSQDGAEFTSKIVPAGPLTPPPELPPAATADVPATTAPSAENVKSEAATSSKNIEVAPPAAPLSDKPADVRVAPPAQDVAQKALLEKKQPEPNSSKGNAFSVQIGVFSDPANVKQLQQKLLSQGYKSYTEKVDTAKGEKIRLRAGPFSTRDIAESALAKIKDSGLSGMVVTK